MRLVPGVAAVVAEQIELPMGRLVGGPLLRLPLAAAVLLFEAAQVAAMPVRLYTENFATSVWDTDPSKVGVELQIGNGGDSPADNVRVTSVRVRGGAFSGPTTLPIAIGTIKPNGSTLLDLLITVPRTDGTAYRLTISGTYRYFGRVHDFSLDRTVAPNSAGPGPVPAQSGVTAKGPSTQLPPAPSPPAATSPPSGPNATAPMLIPIGPPRQLSLPNPTGTDSTIKDR
jgi:hypothetical protein